jgi:hypothetical protein
VIKQRIEALEQKTRRRPRPSRELDSRTDEDKLLGLFRGSALRIDGPPPGVVVPIGPYARDAVWWEYAAALTAALADAPGPVLLLTDAEIERARDLLEAGKLRFSWVKNGAGDVTARPIIPTWNPGKDIEGLWAVTDALNLAIRAVSNQTGERPPETVEDLADWLSWAGGEHGQQPD